jgi:integrase
MLADTANVGALRASLHDIRQRHEAEGRFKADSGYRYAAGSILWTIARDWTGAPGDVIDQMKRDTKKVKPKHQGYMAPSRQKMLDMFDEPARLLAWFDQPAKLLERAERLRRQGRITPSSIVDVQVALLIQMINVLPARPGNLCGQRFKGDPERRNLLLPRTKGGPLFMLWRPSEVKNHEHLKAELDPDAVATLRLYLEHYFPAALRFAGLQDSDYLFPGRKSDKPKSEKQMNRCFRKRMAKAGLDMTLHLGRHLAAKIILDEDEGLIEVVSRLLGHKSLETTRRFYLGTRTEKASERYREVIEAKTAKLRGCRRIRKIRKDDNV